LTDAVVISGAVTVPADDAAVPLVSVPEVADLAIVRPGRDVQLVIQNPTAVSLTAVTDAAGDVIVAPAGTATLPLGPAAEGARLHLLILPADRSQVVTVIVTVEPSDGALVAVGQAIGAHAR